MSGFRDSILNMKAIENMYNNIINILVVCSKKMLEDCIENNLQIQNHEEKIRNELLEKYLENDEIRKLNGFNNFRFIPEGLESYNEVSKTFIGRVDIKVVSENWFRNRNDYCIIECKRIDGNKNLNEKFITQGICRYVSNPVKYPSYNKKNIMFGFVVKNIDIHSNVLQINHLQKQDVSISLHKELISCKKSQLNDHVYTGEYKVNGDFLEIKFLFFDFSPIVEVKES